MIKDTEIRVVHLEPTQLCQASCPMCDRNKNGGEENQYLTNSSISLDDFKKIFSKEFIEQLSNLYMCCNHGDPIFTPDCLDIMKYCRDINPKMSLSITTNGGARSPEWWEELASVVSFVNFSVDGLEDTNHLYRQGVKWSNVETNMDAFISAGGYAKWTFIVFGHNEHQVEEAEQYSKLLGVKDFIIKKSGRYVYSADMKKRETHQATNKKGQKTQNLSQPKQEKYKNKALQKDYDPIVKKHGSMEKYIEVAKIEPKCVKKKEIYVSATGEVYPCCWVNGQVYKWWRPKEQSQEYRLIQSIGGMDKINAKINPLKDIINGPFFCKIGDSWEKQGVAQGRMKICASKCNVGFDPFKAQWQ